MEGGKKPTKEAVLLAYQALRERRLAYDSMMWQSPALGIAAQSFLLSMAFDGSKGVFPNLVCSLLSTGLGLSSIQLMMKHRHHERLTTQQLHKLEVDHGLIQVHERPCRATEDDHFHWLTNFSSFRVWMGGLFATTAAGSIAAILAIGRLLD